MASSLYDIITFHVDEIHSSIIYELKETQKEIIREIREEADYNKEYIKVDAVLEILERRFQL